MRRNQVEADATARSYATIRKWLPVLLTAFVFPSPACGTESINLDRFFNDHCVDCHQGNESSAGIDIDALLASTGGDFNATQTESTSESGASGDRMLDAGASEQSVRQWIRIYDQINKGTMPPSDASQPTAEERAVVDQELYAWLHRAESERARVTLRRLNRREYENTVQDLFGISVRVKEMLPEDATRNGFDTVGDGLELSTEAILAYLNASEVVLDAVFGTDVAPKPILHHTNLLEQKNHQGGSTVEPHFGKLFRKTPDGVVIFQSNYCPTNLLNFARLKAPPGLYRGSVRVRAVQSKQPVTMRIYGGDTIVNRKEKHLVGYFDIPPGEWTTVTFEDRLIDEGGTYTFRCYNTADIRKGADTYTGPGLEIGDITIEGPLDPWPPASRAALLGKVELRSAGLSVAREIFQRLLPRALRREVQLAEVEHYVQIVQSQRDAGSDFESALRVGLTTLLCSPEFLFLAGDPAPPNLSNQTAASDASPGSWAEHVLASRLSYFLWSSTPDEELLNLAREKRLHDPRQLRQQVDRMLSDRRSDRFVNSFVDQWLRLREIDFTEPDPELFPEFDELLRLAMVEETRRFFRAMLDEDLPVRNIIDSDFTFVNARLAAHYGIKGVAGLEYQNVPIPRDSWRGGILTQASVLKVTANGTNTSAVIRGNWVLENILGQTTSPPPSSVPAIEPDIRGAKTPRQQLEAHRSQSSCASCHNKFDPLGFVLESFDPIGGRRDHYRTKGPGGRPPMKQAPFTYSFIKYKVGLPVDASGVTEDGKQFRDIRDFKRWLLSREPDVKRCLAEKLLTYATGRELRFPDRPHVEGIVDRIASNEGGLRSLIHEIVQSSIFQGP